MTGAFYEMMLDDKPVFAYWRYQARAGQILKMTRAKKLECMVIYVFKVVLFCLSIEFLQHGFESGNRGGIEGRCLQAGDQLQTANDHILRSEIGIAPIPLRDVIRALPSSEYQAFKRKSQYYWWRNEWTLQSNSDRMGYRFQGQTLELKQPLEMLSHAIQFGSVQVPPSGQPIILMADAQTTGGYPKIANVIDVDLGALAQVRLGSTIKFEAVSLQEAAKLRRKK